MNTIEYNKNKKALHSNYYDTFSQTLIDNVDQHLMLGGLKYKGQQLTFKKFITLPISDLIKLKTELDKYCKKNQIKKNGIKVTPKNFKKLFTYSKLQPKLATFFMNQTNVKLRTCHYCGLDFVNAFRDFPYFKDGYDFVNNADKYDLTYIKGLTEKDAIEIIKKRGKTGYTDYSKVPVSKKSIINSIKKIGSENTHNHFTLDHLLPQNSSKYFSLCLYNLVPSCYSCNSKFKNKIEFSIDKKLSQISPTSDKYSFNSSFNFELLFSGKIDNIKTEDDFDLMKSVNNNIDHVNTYLRMFKIMGRYIAHKGEILSLIQKKQKYPESKIVEFSRLTGLPKKEIRKMLFGEDLFDSNFDGKPLVKFRRDLAKNIKLKDVI